MTDRRGSESALLAHPLVLRAAWLRVDAWYRSGNLAPQPELSRWRLHPEAELRRLGCDLASGDWRLEPWVQLPYPKKGACLRHYLQPTVRDQVAFMAHAVLLGPLIDSRVRSFAFGNRWYRPLAWDRRSRPPGWVRRPYPLLTSRSYLPYAQSHGLFRRVAHWTVARMTGAEVPGEDLTGRVQLPGDYKGESLPPWVRTAWWPHHADGPRRACWTALDLQLAYPSVRLDRLRDSLVKMLGGEAAAGFSDELFGGYPRAIVEALGSPSVRVALAHRLVDALTSVRVHDGGIPRDAWRPHHAAPELPPDKDPGLPTGLAISGLLLNAVLSSADEVIYQFLTAQTGDQRGAIVRFADDMILLDRSVDGLLNLVEAVWRAVAGDPDATLDVPRSASNLHLNLHKVGPPSVHRLVLEYLQAKGWTKCRECRSLVPPSTAAPAQRLARWWAERSEVDGAALREAVERSTVGPGDLGPFVTTLVERLSEIGNDTLSERFGGEARDRLIQLHELARFDIKDEQVRPDTRRSFAVNRLVRAWLPADEVPASAALAKIRGSVAHVLRETPWKFSLWRAVVRAAARRTVANESGRGDQDADTWLADQLSRLASGDRDSLGADAWLRTWPEEEADLDDHQRDPSWRPLYLSFHRTAFWHALAEVLRELWRHVDRGRQADAGPSPRSWTTRAIPAGHHEHVARILGSTDRWISALYTAPHPDLRALSWELDVLVEAVLAAVPRSDLAEAWRRTRRPDDALVVPENLPWLASQSKTSALLKLFGRLQPPEERARKLNTAALAHVALGGPDRRVGPVLYPVGQAPRIQSVQGEPAHAVAVATSMGCARCVGAEVAAAIVIEPAHLIKALRDDPLALWEYGQARRILLGHNRVSS